MFNIHVQGIKESRAHKNMDNILAVSSRLKICFSTFATDQRYVMEKSEK